MQSCPSTSLKLDADQNLVTAFWQDSKLNLSPDLTCCRAISYALCSRLLAALSLLKKVAEHVKRYSASKSR